MFSKLFNRDSNKKSIRIKADAGNPSEKYISIQLTQSFDFLEFLSLKLSQKDIYRLFDSDYGVVAGRVIGNEGVGLPNCKVAIFIPIDEEDSTLLEQRPTTVTDIIKKVGASLYPYTNVSDTNDEGIRYNLLPSHRRNRWFNGFPSNMFGIGATPKTPVGTFPDKEEVIVNPSFMHVYKKYYKYTTVTNEAGDFMLFGVPTGNHTLHMDCDLTDIGKWSMSPLLMNKVLGYPDSLFSEDGTMIEASSDLNTMPNIQTQNIPVFVKPLWTQNEGSTVVGITRQDFKISGDIKPYFNLYANGFTQDRETYIGDRVIFRLIIGNKHIGKVKVDAFGIDICYNFYLPSFKGSEFFKNKPCQLCGGLYDEPAFTIKWTWNPIVECGDDFAYNGAIDAFNRYVMDKTKVSDVTNYTTLNAIAPYKLWIGTPSTSSQTFLEKINESRASKGLYPLPDDFKIAYPEMYGVTRTKSEYPALLSIITRGEETEETEFAAQAGLEAGLSSGDPAYTEFSPPSKIPSTWTAKFNLANVRKDIIRTKVFSYRDSSDITNQMILSKSSLIDTERHIYMLREDEYVLFSQKGIYLAQVPCNRTKVITAEDGRLIPTTHPTKGVYSEFAGYFIFSMDGEIENPANRLQSDRVRIKVPQSLPVYVKRNETNPAWIKEAHIFESGEMYSVAQYIYALQNASYEDRIGTIARTNERGTPMVDVIGGSLISYGFPYNNVYQANKGEIDEANIYVFENEWLNFNLYFLQYMYKVRNRSHNNFVCNSVIANKHRQLTDNNDSIGGGEKSTRGLINGANFKTKIIKINKTDFIRFFTKQDSGFSTGKGIVLETENEGTYAKTPTGEKTTFYKGYFSDSIKYLVDKGLV
jgi:hypothetical protein